MKVLLIDNYDSFTYNIVELLRCLHIRNFTVVKNDEISIDTARTFNKVIISPGPDLPAAAGNILSIIQALAPTHSILGICLGHQAIAEAFGAVLKNEVVPYHGFQTSLQVVKRHRIFYGIHGEEGDYDQPLRVGLYHSWTVEENSLPSCLEVTSYSTEGNIMSLKHKAFDLHGVQFHPESYMTDFGKEILGNFLEVPDR